LAKTSLPADQQVPELIVAAHTNPYGIKAADSRGNLRANTDPNVALIWAPAEGIWVADAKHGHTIDAQGTIADTYRLHGGTSDGNESFDREI
jgi:hypothetical protein